MNASKTETATLGGGCFWCLEAVFEMVRGVQKVVPGYSGGHVRSPSYEQVCTGATGHAEVVQVTFDPEVLPYEGLLGLFFASHDPTTLDRQGADVGPQYRSVVFYHTQEQEETARRVIARLEEEKGWEDPIVTEVKPFADFFPAEEYHRGYYRKNPNAAYCAVVISPKVAKLRREYSSRLKG